MNNVWSQIKFQFNHVYFRYVVAYLVRPLTNIGLTLWALAKLCLPGHLEPNRHLCRLLYIETRFKHSGHRLPWLALPFFIFYFPLFLLSFLLFSPLFLISFFLSLVFRASLRLAPGIPIPVRATLLAQVCSSAVNILKGEHFLPGRNCSWSITTNYKI